MTCATVLVAEAVATTRAIGEAVVTCGQEVPHGTGVTEPGEIPTRVGLIIFLGTRGPVGRDGRQSVRGVWYPGGFGCAFMKASTEPGPLGGSILNLKGTGWETYGTSWLTDGDEVASGTDCTVISGTRLMPSKSFVSDARSMFAVSPVGALASSTRSTANEAPPPAWPWLPRLLLRRRGR
jgi:hypothetical protein